MKTQLVQIKDELWGDIVELFPQTVRWLDDLKEQGHYYFFAAIDEYGTFVGASVIDIRPMGFGPLKEMTVGFLENIEILPAHRQKGFGRQLLIDTLDFAWKVGCQNVRWTVDYQNEAGIGLYRSLNLGFVPEEDPDSEDPVFQYTVVALKPNKT